MRRAKRGADRGGASASPIGRSLNRSSAKCRGRSDHPVYVAASRRRIHPSSARRALHKKYIAGAHRAPLQLRTPSCRGGL